jgi:hypothetical protein
MGKIYGNIREINVHLAIECPKENKMVKVSHCDNIDCDHLWGRDGGSIDNLNEYSSIYCKYGLKE